MAKWGGPSGNLTWPLNPSKNNKTQQRNQNKQKTNQKQKKKIRRA